MFQNARDIIGIKQVPQSYLFEEHVPQTILVLAGKEMVLAGFLKLSRQFGGAFLTNFEIEKPTVDKI